MPALSAIQQKANNITVPAYLDKEMQDRPGETWKDVPGLEDYFHVSNFGRVKRLEREIHDTQGGVYTFPAAIRQAVVNRDRNLHCHDWTYRLQVVLQMHRVKHSFQVARLVYYCFVELFDFNDSSIVITTRNGNGLDIRPENLVLMDRFEKCQRPYDTGRQLSHLQTDKYKLIEIVAASKAKTSLMVSQYYKEGKRLQIFSCIMDAAKTTKIEHSAICGAAKKHDSTAGGYYWRYGDATKLNLKELHALIKKRKQSYREQKGVKVTQYDLEGNPVAVYPAMSTAAKKTGIAHKSIALNAKGKSAHAGGYLWRMGHHTEKLLLNS